MKFPLFVVALSFVTASMAKPLHPVAEVGIPTCEAGPNSASDNGAFLRADGTLSIASNDLVFTGTRLPKNQLCILVAGLSGPQFPFGDGFLCLNTTPGVLRLNLLRSSPSGIATVPVDYMQGMASLLMPGSTRTFHLVYRDGLSTGTQVNATTGLEVTFVP